MTGGDAAFHPLHWPLAPWWRRGLFSRAALDRAAADHGLVSGSGRPLRFVSPGGGESYEARAYRRGEVETRDDNWHDRFGAWVWLSFPRAKAALNRRHWQALAASGAQEGARRSPLQDALTQFDECGVVVLHTDADLWGGLRAHRWREVFVDRRRALRQHLRFLVFGHGSHDALRHPFPGLCGKALGLAVPALPEDGDALVALADRHLAAFFDGAGPLAPRDWQPLPLLGIPGATADNEDPGYYDGPQFRPRRGGGEAVQAVQSGREVRQAIAVPLTGIEESPGPIERDAG